MADLSQTLKNLGLGSAARAGTNYALNGSFTSGGFDPLSMGAGMVGGFLGDMALDGFSGRDPEDSATGGAIGSGIGSALGTAILPGIGTLFGAYLGKFLGGMAGGGDPDIPYTVGSLNLNNGRLTGGGNAISANHSTAGDWTKNYTGSLANYLTNRAGAEGLAFNPLYEGLNFSAGTRADDNNKTGIYFTPYNQHRGVTEQNAMDANMLDSVRMARDLNDAVARGDMAALQDIYGHLERYVNRNGNQGAESAWNYLTSSGIVGNPNGMPTREEARLRAMMHSYDDNDINDLLEMQRRGEAMPGDLGSGVYSRLRATDGEMGTTSVDPNWRLNDTQGQYLRTPELDNLVWGTGEFNDQFNSRYSDPNRRSQVEALFRPYAGGQNVAHTMGGGPSPQVSQPASGPSGIAGNGLNVAGGAFGGLNPASGAFNMAKGGRVKGALARHVAQSGRHGDTELVHMNPKEVAALDRMAGGRLPRNPETGYPEAFDLSDLFDFSGGGGMSIDDLVAGDLGLDLSGLAGNIIPGGLDTGSDYGGDGIDVGSSGSDELPLPFDANNPPPDPSLNSPESPAPATTPAPAPSNPASDVTRNLTNTARDRGLLDLNRLARDPTGYLSDNWPALALAGVGIPMVMNMLGKKNAASSSVANNANAAQAANQAAAGAAQANMSQPLQKMSFDRNRLPVDIDWLRAGINPGGLRYFDNANGVFTPMERGGPVQAEGGTPGAMLFNRLRRGTLRRPEPAPEPEGIIPVRGTEPPIPSIYINDRAFNSPGGAPDLSVGGLRGSAMAGIPSRAAVSRSLRRRRSSPEDSSADTLNGRVLDALRGAGGAGLSPEVLAMLPTPAPRPVDNMVLADLGLPQNFAQGGMAALNAMTRPTTTEGRQQRSMMRGTMRGPTKGGPAHVPGSDDGQADTVPAMLSSGEYVMDAQTVADIGGGNNASGARKLDKLRDHVATSRGRKGKNPPHAKPIGQYARSAGIKV